MLERCPDTGWYVVRPPFPEHREATGREVVCEETGLELVEWRCGRARPCDLHPRPTVDEPDG